MKKQLIFMVISLFLLQGCGSSSDNDKIEDNMTNDEAYKLSFMSFDKENDAKIDRNITMTYNEKGDVLVERTEWNHYDGDGENVWLYTNNYSEEGLLLTTTHLNNYDETFVTTCSYDENRNKIKEINRDSDEEIESIGEYTYDEYHNILTDSHDSDGNGIVDYITRYIYDQNRKILTEITTYDDEDIANDIVSGDIQTYTYDSNEKKAILNIDKGNDGTIDDIYTYVWIKI